MIKLGKRPTTKYRVISNTPEHKYEEYFNTYLDAQEHLYHCIGREIIQYNQWIEKVERGLFYKEVRLTDPSGKVTILSLEEVTDYE